ncbi:uncharacterized protein N0V89_010254 [Didymosphaeria variabile]|uniref:Uncharacterized protein n=1 Tax=Didymosphaeria variabile TaxID=1932322 RepID=A0A9W9C5C1_9PLEO|nr:uncharacterized protein N0V89_010254 [Didymosphaeria variabile]KAJ4346325.1 hypothetical protein N0V89_010254 [Didymosphaeria variabile]
METLQGSLDSILQRHFWIVPARTNRHDQRYKRSYQSWKDKHGDREPVILAPKTSRAEWTSEVHMGATAFARSIEQRATDLNKHRGRTSRTPQEKLFSDDVFGLPLDILGPYSSHDSPLKPAMQRTSYWTGSPQKSQDPRRTYYRAIRALLACEQTEPLCYLAECASTRIKAAADVQVDILCSSRRSNIGWLSMIDEMLELALSLVMLKSFSESLPLAAAHETWVPFVFALSDATHSNTTTAEKLQSMSYDRGDIRTMEKGVDDVLNRCHRILVVTQVLVSACGMPPVNWVQCFADAFLHFVGFECWNREREGQSYLGCNLNVRKDGAWLQKMSRSAAKPEGEVTEMKQNKSKDPLLLREPRRDADLEIHADAEESDVLEELDILEAQEIAYGLKRSTKYHKTHLK